jgi:hypothetical protein
MRKILHLVVIALIGTGLGCSMAQKGSTVVKHEANEQPIEKVADVSGMYALYAADDIEPKTTVQVEKGQALGFRKDDRTGRIIAIAGDRDPIPLETGKRYYWRRL